MKKSVMKSSSLKCLVCVFGILFMLFSVGSGVVIAKEKTKVIKMTCHYSRPHPYAQNAYYFADSVKKLSGGKMKIRIFEGGVLAKLKEEFKVVSEGVVDMGWIWISAYEAGKMPIADVFNIPFFISSLDDWHKKEEEIRNIMMPDFEKYNAVPVHLWLVAGYVVCGQKPFEKAADLKDILIRAPGGNFTKSISLWGGKPVSLTVGDIYTALQRGTVGGTVITLPSYFGLKLYEVTTNVTLTPFPCLAGGVVISKPVWDKLNANERKILRDSGKNAAANYTALYKKDLDNAVTRAEKTGEKISYLTPEVIDELKDVISPLWDKYLAKTGEKGKKIVKILRRKE